MSKLLIVEESTILCGIYKKLLEKDGGFNFDIVQSYEKAKECLHKYRYEFSVVSRTLPDANHGEVIALLNKHNVAPIVYTTSIDEDLMESFESARVVQYILRHRYDNVKYVISRLNTLKENKKRTVLVAHHSEIYRHYLKQNLSLHNFKVILVASGHEAIQKLQLHDDISLMIVNEKLGHVNGLENMNGLELVRKVREMKLSDLNILALADDSNSYMTSLFLNEGANDYLMSQSSRDEFYVRIYQNIK